MTCRAFAPAKVNLSLEIHGRRADGYHLLSSLVVFAGVGDEVEAVPDDDLRLTLRGPNAAGLQNDPENLVLDAARALAHRAQVMARGAHLTLTKNLPIAAGLGGGSADAAATLRVLERLWEIELAPSALAEIALALGADVPVCLAGVPAMMSGIGERCDPLPPLPPAALLLVNPRRPLATGAVFRALGAGPCEAAPAPPAVPTFADAAALAAWLDTHPNDLEAPARRLEPAIGEVLAAIGSAPDCLLARMSGSGATCFGLFAETAAAEAAAAALRGHHPGWWIAAAPLLSAPPSVTAD